MSASNEHILVLYYFPGRPENMRAAIRHHLTALNNAEKPRKVWYVNAAHPVPRHVRRTRFRAIVLHTTFLCMRWSHLFPFWKWHMRWINDKDCLKIALPQDEYDHSEVLDEWLEEMGVQVVFSNFPVECHETLYPRSHRRARILHAFTGFIDEDAARAVAPHIRPIAQRPLDIVYRAFNLPYWFGSHGQRKSSIATDVLERIKGLGLAADISTRPEDVIVGDAWFDFMASGRCVIGCESGSSVLDRRGEMQGRIRSLLAHNPDLSFDEVSALMPDGWDSYRFFAISPRHFEAVITKTAQILVEGTYDGVFKPDRHYIPLRQDLSNMDEVVEKVRDHDYLQRLVDTAYQEIYLVGRYSYKQFAMRLEAVLEEHAGEAGGGTFVADVLSRFYAPRMSGGKAATAQAR